MKERVLLFFLGYCVVKVYGQIGVTGCTVATQANCPNFLPNSYCNLGSLLCECPAGYTATATNVACEYNCGALTDPDNGAVSTPAGTHTGDPAQYTCVSTFKVVGTATRTCQQDVGWDGAAPTCEPAELGDACSTNIFQCSNIANGGCVAFSTCQCNAGYEDDGTGLACSEINECATNPCQNGATCVDQIASYACTCVAGYDGNDCENNINECAGSPCQNGGVCSDGINQYTCACVPGYDGGDCQNNIDECTPNQCQNSGTCVDGINAYTCTCLPGYNGDNCENNIDECTPNQCQNGATCVDGINAYTCTCVAGYEGNNCQTNINECIGNVCQNGATCVDGIDQYTCTCVAGYDGNFCQNNINECASHACQNGATCVDGINTYTCVCVAGYDGTFCDNNIDECAADPCTNGGTCVDKINDYTCNCVAGYTDKTCATNIDDCATSPCQNGGTCQDAVNDYTCVCVAGYTDKNCQTNINECDSHACNNGATCVDRVNAYECVCAAGWEGTFCTSNIDECDSDPCQNGGTCVDEVDQYTCNCVPGYNGDECENNIDECIGNLCENGATCVDGINAYTCDCVPGYDGTYCEIDIDECASHSCQNSATCVDQINDYTCVCAAGYTDRYCQTDINECASSPCQNGGTCTDQVNGYICTCNNGFTGLTCRPGELGDDCSARAVVCDNLANAECDGSICVCESGYEDPTGATGSCSRVDCGTLTPPTDGAVDHTSEGTDYESKAYFSCNAGYTLTGLSSVTCQADKSWNGATPTCVIKDCGSVAAILNGAFQYTPNKLYQGLAEFSCNTGYTLVGDATRTCQDTGVWSGANPVCQINDCGTIVAPANGNVDLTDGTTYESVAVFQCNNGYDMAGAASLECLEDGSWDSAKPTCNIKDCGFLTNPANGAVDNSEGTTYLSNALFTCNIGYTLVGSSTRRCQASGTWSGTDPVCQINDCGVLTNPANGNVDISSGTSYGNTASYSCDAGFELNGVLQRTCQADSSWSSSAPTCDRLDCGNLKSPTSGSVDLSGGTLFEATAVFTCNPGYTLTGDSERYCTNTGDWDNSNPTCIIKDCGPLTDPENGQVLTVHGTTYNEEAEYSCNSGYQVNGVSTRTCEDDGRWSASDPTCEILDCGFVADIVNGGISYSVGTIYGSTVYYVCDNGYEVTGVASRVCLATGSWSDNQPVCTILDCDAAISVPHAVSKTPSGSQVGDVAIYECNSGYGLVGNPNVTCEASGFWGTVPECRLDCGIPPVVENGQVTYTAGTLVSATATYTCNDGYYISGISRIECQDTRLLDK
ncbi:fibropellin-1-like isoform X2 [Ruditapes philippinarum]|uniref:fibropellin-1-like isoform X2 n=1 Tax=Ruditapes philippinarum TaxID=129788 RepID=UPI00295A90F7|nr:fibropellin-1-like isoform X2 [Ruditapes philippinarum]